MKRSVDCYCFWWLPLTALEGIESDINLAACVAECLHGKLKVRAGLENHAIEKHDDVGAVALRVRGEAGKTVAAVLAGLLDRRIEQGQYWLDIFEPDEVGFFSSLRSAQRRFSEGVIGKSSGRYAVSNPVLDELNVRIGRRPELSAEGLATWQQRLQRQLGSADSGG